MQRGLLRDLSVALALKIIALSVIYTLFFGTGHKQSVDAIAIERVLLPAPAQRDGT